MAKRPPDSKEIVVLLRGQRWAALAPQVAALERDGGILFLNPRGDRAGNAQALEGHVLLGGTDVLGAWTEPDGLWAKPGLPVLLCLTPEETDNEDLFKDADDVLVIPCSAPELHMRVRRLARRTSNTSPDPVMRLGSLVLDPTTYQVMMEGRQVTLAWQEYQLLKFLMENPGRVFSRQQILAEVWGVQDYGGTRTVDVHIRRLRFKLGAAGDDLFRTVKNVGYGLVAASEARGAPRAMPRGPFLARS